MYPRFAACLWLVFVIVFVPLYLSLVGKSERNNEEQGDGLIHYHHRPFPVVELDHLVFARGEQQRGFARKRRDREDDVAVQLRTDRDLRNLVLGLLPRILPGGANRVRVCTAEWKGHGSFLCACCTPRTRCWTGDSKVYLLQLSRKAPFLFANKMEVKSWILVSSSPLPFLISKNELWRVFFSFV